MKPFHHYFFILTLAFSYYVAWAFNDAACVISGLAYEGYDEKSKSHGFRRIYNIYEYYMFTGGNVAKMTSHWNASIAAWLKKYVYTRLVFHSGGKAGFSQFIFTFIVSAFWHGFYPGYYFFFFYMGIFVHMFGVFRRYYSWYFRFIPQFLQTIIGNVLSYQYVSYGGAAFAIYGFNDILFYFNCQYWYGHVLLITAVLIHVSPIGRALVSHSKKMMEIEKAKKEAEAKDSDKDTKKER